MQVPITLIEEVNKSYSITIDTLPSLTFDRKVAVITNPKISGLHLKYLLDHIQANELYVITIPDGEAYKHLQTIEQILDNLFEHRLDRKSLLIGFGGGVIGDMTGFTASIFQRGIEFIQVPTTLLSQVDASVGGKTGVNNRFGKNLIGAFHQPNAVYIDPHFLTTLPPREYGAGIAEIIKMAVTFDQPFFEWCQQNNLRDQEVIKEAIKRSVEIKANVVSRDEKENGIRAALNYGHTFAHVIENESGYGQLFHGEAVAIGMVMANELARQLGLMSEQEADAIKAVL
jgi:3-dehydroquinate synthase